MTAILVTGAGGQLGSDLLASAPVVHGLDAAALDITDGARVREAVASFAASYPDPVVINAAAYTAVDAAETDVERAHLVNAVAPGLLAAACGVSRVPLVHVSTDYVFPGTAERPYEVDDPVGPRSVYGRTKLAGERAVLSCAVHAYVVRTAWVYGEHGGGNFVRTMVGLQASRDTLTVVDDQHGSPTWSADLAAGLVELAGAAHRLPSGILHCTNSGATTWYGFARAIFAELGADPERVRPCTSEQFQRPAPRPAYSVLSPASWAAAGLTPLRPWREALSAAFAARIVTV